MDNRKVIAIALVAIVCVATVVVYVSNDGRDDEPTEQEIRDDALSPDVWQEHLEDLLRFWDSSDATDMSTGLFNTYLSNSGDAYTSDDPNLPEEVLAAFEMEPGLMDVDNNYVRAHSRLTYAYGVAFHMTGDPQYLELCRQGTLALQEAIGEDGSMPIKKDRITGEWDDDPDARTSQDLSYGVLGMAMYYYLTHDPAVLESILLVKDYIFDNYYDEDRGLFTWYPKHVDDDQAQLVAILDQLNAYMVLLTPELPEPYRSEWEEDLVMLADILIDRFYSDEYGLFWGDISKPENMQLGSNHVDYGHSIKSLWVLMQIGDIVDDPYYIEFSKPKIDRILEEAFVEEDGSWASKPNADGSVNAIKEWWIYAELDQAAEMMALHDVSYYKYLNETQRYWLETMVDHEYGEMWHMVDANGEPVIHYPKTHNWKTSFHSFEHALLSYMSASYLKGMDFELYYVFPADAEIDPEDIHPYVLDGEVVSMELMGPSGIGDGSEIYKMTYHQPSL